MPEMTASEFITLKKQMETLIEKYSNMDALAKNIVSRYKLLKDIDSAAADIKKLAGLPKHKAPIESLMKTYKETVLSAIVDLENEIEKEYHSACICCKEVLKYIKEEYCFRAALLYIFLDFTENENIESAIKEWDKIFSSPEKSSEIKEMIDESYKDAEIRETVLRRVRKERGDITIRSDCVFIPKKEEQTPPESESLFVSPKLNLKALLSVLTRER